MSQYDNRSISKLVNIKRTGWVIEKTVRKESSGQWLQKHTTFAPARQKLFGFRLRSPLLPSRNHALSVFKRFFHPLAFAKQEYLSYEGKASVFSKHPACSDIMSFITEKEMLTTRILKSEYLCYNLRHVRPKICAGKR
jgi:hypothetical protein